MALSRGRPRATMLKGYSSVEKGIERLQPAEGVGSNLSRASVVAAEADDWALVDVRGASVWSSSVWSSSVSSSSVWSSRA